MMTEPASAQRRRDRLLVGVLLALVLLVFGRVCAAEFIEWDDPGTIASNPDFDGPILSSLRSAWTESSKGLYVPVTLTVWTLLAHAARTTQPDAVGSTINPWLFHSFNVACHLASTALVFVILRRLMRTSSAAWIGAAIVALHPMQVETVAWASGTKDLLSWLVCLAAVLIYLRRAQAIAAGTSLWRGGRAMPAVALLLVLALLSKPSAMVLPAVLFVIDALLVRSRPARRVAIDLVPIVAIAVVGAIIARQAQYVSHVEAAPIWSRPFVAGDALCHYLQKIVWPQTLVLDYGRSPRAVLAQTSTYVRWLVPVAVGGVAWFARRRVPELLAGTLIAVIGVGPVLGFATFQMQGYSTVTDHYVYFSMFGIGLIGASLVDRFGERSRAIRPIAIVVIAALAARSFVQAGMWHDTVRIVGHSYRANPDSVAMANNMASYYLAIDPPRPDLAEPFIDRAVAINPNLIYTVSNFIECRALTGRLSEANAELATLSEMMNDTRFDRSERVQRLSNTSLMLLSAGRVADARRWADRAIAIAPNSHVAQQASAAVTRAQAKVDHVSTQPSQ